MKSVFVSNPMFNQIWLCWLVSCLRVIHIFPCLLSWLAHLHFKPWKTQSGWSRLLNPPSSNTLGQNLWLFSYFLVCLSACVVSNLYSQFLLVSLFYLLPGPSQPLPARHGVTSCHVYTKQSAVAKPLICLFDRIAPLSVSLWELISYLMNKSSCQSLCSKNFLALPPLLTTLVNLLSPHILHLQQHRSPQTSPCWLLNSPLSSAPCFFCRAAMPHPCISIYIQFSDKARCTSLPANCKPLWPKLQRFFTKSLTRYS